MRNGALSSAHAAASAPLATATSIPAAAQHLARPGRGRARAGRAAPITTRATPAATRASAHGGVRPWWEQGSRVQTIVAPRAASPAAASAAASACGRPGPLVPALGDRRAVAQHHGADEGVGAHAPPAAQGELPRPRQRGRAPAPETLTRPPGPPARRTPPPGRRPRRSSTPTRTTGRRRRARPAASRGRCPRRSRSPPGPEAGRAGAPPGACRRDELLAGEPGIDREHVHVVEILAELGDVLDRRSRVERQPREAPGGPDLGQQSVRVGVGLHVDRDRVGGLGEEGDHAAGAGDHEVHVHEAARGVDRRRDGPGEVGAEREVGDEVGVHHVDVEGARPGADERVELLADAQHVSRHQRREHLPRRERRRAHPALIRAMKNPSVPCRWGSVSSASGRRGWARPGYSAPRSSSRAPAASTTSSFSSAISVQVE